MASSNWKKLCQATNEQKKKKNTKKRKREEGDDQPRKRAKSTYEAFAQQKEKDKQQKKEKRIRFEKRAELKRALASTESREESIERRKAEKAKRRAEKKSKSKRPAPVSSKQKLKPTCDNMSWTRFVGLDCEMVGVGTDGKRSVLAQVVVINEHLNVIYQSYVRTPERVTDFRTWVSGIQPHHIKKRNEEAVSFDEAQARVAEILDGRILVGHGLSNDLKALMLTHPKKMIRDTALWTPLKFRGRPQKLKYLTKQHLDIDIQTGEHSPAEDAVAAMLVYKHHKEKWEAFLRRRFKKKGPDA